MNLKTKDVVIIGAGPAGMTAAVYANSGGLSVTLLESGMYGGQVAVSSVIDNYPGVGKVGGYELADMMFRRVEECGIEPVCDTARRIEATGGIFKVSGETSEYFGRCVIIANGVKRREAGFEGERTYTGRGVSYCAVCDGSFYREADVCVIGGGNSALEEALYLSGICRKVYLVHRREAFRAEERYIRELETKHNVEKITSHIPVKVSGDTGVRSLEIKDTASGKARVLDVSGVFVSVGLVPDNVRFLDVLKLTEDGYIISDEDCKTSTSGVFVCGDTRDRKLRQITTAVSDGAIAATRAAEYVRVLEEKRKDVAFAEGSL